MKALAGEPTPFEAVHVYTPASSWDDQDDDDDDDYDDDDDDDNYDNDKYLANGRDDKFPRVQSCFTIGQETVLKKTFALRTKNT